MNNDNLNVSHPAWYGLIALYTARRDGEFLRTGQPVSDALACHRQKQRRFPRELTSDISWLLKEGGEKACMQICRQA